MATTTEAPSRQKRRVNDLMREGLHAYDSDEPIPFFCECSLADCYRAVWLTAREYDGARRDEQWQPLADHAQDGHFTPSTAYAAAGARS